MSGGKFEHKLYQQSLSDSAKTLQESYTSPSRHSSMPLQFFLFLDTFVFSLDPRILKEILLGYWLVMWLNLLAAVCVSSAMHTQGSVLCVQMETQGTLALKHDSECNSSRVHC